MTRRAETAERPLSASQEDYLEAIYHLARGRQSARTRDIADRLRVRQASVSAAVKELAAQGLVEHSAYGSTKLTRRGRTAARGVAGRHLSLRDFLETVLGLKPAQAERTACIMEHGAPPELPARLAAVTAILRDRPGLLRRIRTAGCPPRGRRA